MKVLVSLRYKNRALIFKNALIFWLKFVSPQNPCFLWLDLFGRKYAGCQQLTKSFFPLMKKALFSKTYANVIVVTGR